MQNEQRAEFEAHVWKTVRRTGRSAPTIANEIIGEFFPETLGAAEKEGADKMLRNGVIAFIKRIIREKDKERPDAATIDMAEIEPSFRPYVEALDDDAYYVEQCESHLTVRELIDDPALLDDARKFMRKKGDECHAKADKLDALYEAVMARRSHH